MKITNKLSNQSTMFVSKYLPDKSNDDLEIIKYGFQLFYMTIYKFVIIILLSIYLNTLTETLTMFFMFGIARTFASGAHAKNWLTCTLLSVFTFVIIPIIIKNMTILLPVYISLLFISLLFFLLYAPADTKFRPITNIKKRKTLKFLSISTLFIYLILFILIKDIYLKKLLVFSIFTAALMTTPVVYKLLGNSYSTKT